MNEEAESKEFQIGDDLGSHEYVVTEEMVREFADGLEDHHPWYLEGSPFGSPIAHPTMTVRDFSPLIKKLGREAASGLHAKQETELFNPVKIGTRVTVRGKVADRYEKPGRKYLVWEYSVFDEDNVELVRHRGTGVTMVEEAGK